MNQEEYQLLVQNLELKKIEMLNLLIIWQKGKKINFLIY